MNRFYSYAAALICAAASASAIDCSFEASYPRQYIGYKIPDNQHLVLDGKLDDALWEEVPWTSDFVDISTSTTPKYQTRAKIRWDDTFLYVGAEIHEPQIWANISHTCHCLDPYHDQIIFHDNDFEIFVDSDGSTHYYKEYEMNAHNATWDLCLNKPYGDKGYENSTRVFGDKGFDMQPPLHCGTHIEGGQINAPGSGNRFWSVEVALPLEKLNYNKTARFPPVHGDYWRINFSRVEWNVEVVNGKYEKYPSCQSCPVPGADHEDNWVWSPQGSIAMHLPEKWGFLQLSTDPPGTTKPVRNKEWTVRSVAAALYYAQHAYARVHNNTKYAADVASLESYAPANTLDGTCTGVPQIQLSVDQKNFIAFIDSKSNDMVASIRDDRLLFVKSK